MGRGAHSGSPTFRSLRPWLHDEVVWLLPWPFWLDLLSARASQAPLEAQVQHPGPAGAARAPFQTRATSPFHVYF